MSVVESHGFLAALPAQTHRRSHSCQRYYPRVAQILGALGRPGIRLWPPGHVPEVRSATGWRARPGRRSQIRFANRQTQPGSRGAAGRRRTGPARGQRAGRRGRRQSRNAQHPLPQPLARRARARPGWSGRGRLLQRGQTELRRRAGTTRRTANRSASASSHRPSAQGRAATSGFASTAMSGRTGSVNGRR